MFDNLSDRLGGVFKRLRGKGRLTQADVDEVMGEIRTALLEADVNVGVVRNVVERIRVQAVGTQVSEALDPGQQIIKIVNGLYSTLPILLVAITFTVTAAVSILIMSSLGFQKSIKVVQR